MFNLFDESKDEFAKGKLPPHLRELIEQKVDSADGSASGRYWAENQADVSELKRLENWFWFAAPDEDELWFAAVESDVIAKQWLHAMLQGLETPDPVEAELYWYSILGDQVSRTSKVYFLEGFVDGALEYLHETEDDQS
jgi:hypothetical protein